MWGIELRMIDEDEDEGGVEIEENPVDEDKAMHDSAKQITSAIDEDDDTGTKAL